MAERDFYTVSQQISYPLLSDDSKALTPSGVLPDAALLDAGFLLGLDSGFVPGQHEVYLYSVEVSGTTITFDFRSDAPGLLLYRWLFQAETGGVSGCPIYTDAVLIAGGPDSPDRGTGFLAVGDLTELAALGDGLWLTGGTPRVEPALLQSMIDSFARSVNLANDARRCPPQCGSSASSESAETFLQAGDLVGDLKFREGYNSRIVLNRTDNSIQLGANRGSGAGETCEDVIIDEGGFQPGAPCSECDGYINSINGKTAQSGQLRLVAGPGMVVVPDPDNHKIVIRVESNRVCGSSSSG